MKKSSFYYLVLSSFVLNIFDANAYEDTDFQEVANPVGRIAGAYYGLGLGISNISHKLKAMKVGRADRHLNKTVAQYDVSLIGGFGTGFRGNYYIGVEFDLFKRLPKKTNRSDEGIGLAHKSNIGLNMDVRFGYQPIDMRTLFYVTGGFSRVVGDMLIKDNSGKEHKLSFGSFFPTIGCGIEHKINQKWNARVDARIAIASKEKKKIDLDGITNSLEAKPSRYAFRFSVTKSI